jgi:transposase
MIDIHTLRENLRLLLNFSHYSNREIARHNKCSHQNVGRFRKILSTLDIDYDGVDILSDAELIQYIYPKKFLQCYDKVLPDFESHHREGLKKSKYRKSTTIQYLEYKAKHGDKAYGKTRYFELVRTNDKYRRIAMKQQYLPGEVLFIDYAGMKVHYTQGRKINESSIFVACIGYSKKLFAFATQDMTSKSWVYALSKAMTYYQGSPEVVQFDNAKAMVTKSGRLANLNDNAIAFARHYGCICDTSRVATPTDNGNAEAAVKFITQRVLVPMKSDMTFFSLAEVNAYLIQEIEKLNNLLFQKFAFSRNDLFYGEERAALSALPQLPYHAIHNQRVVSVPVDYMLLHEGHYYSVPHSLCHKKVLIQVTDHELIVRYQNKEVARHLVSDGQKQETRLAEHMKPSHLAELRKNKDVFLSWAQGISHDVERFIEKQYLLTKNPHSRAIGKRCSALQKLCDTCGEDVFSSACHYALSHNITTPTDLALVIRAKAFDTASEPNAVGHSNIRGKEYFEENSHE